MRRDRLVGAGVVISGLLMLFALIPAGIVVPGNLKTLSLSPDFWPKIVAGIFVLMGLLMIAKPEVPSEESTGMSLAVFVSRLPRLATVLAALFAFYLAIPRFGMVVPAMLLIFGLMVFAGERRWSWMIGISLIVPVLLYWFFVSVASIPIPLGIFESLRG